MGDVERKPETPNTSNLSMFMRDESLAGFIARNANLDRDRFLAKHQYPVLLTSMPTDAALTACSILIPLRKRAAKPKAKGSAQEKTISTRVAAAQREAAQRANSFLVGRAPDCDVVMAPKSLSRRHAVIALDGNGTWTITDLGSCNGTLVDGRRLTPQQPLAVERSPVRLDLGPDVLVHFLLPIDLFVYVRRFTDDASATPHMPFPAVKVSPSERLSTATPRPDDDFTREVGATVHDDLGDTHGDLPLLSPAASSGRFGLSKTPQGGLSKKIDPDIEAKLLKAIETIVSVDPLVLNITARLAKNDQMVTVYSSESTSRVADAAEQLVRMGPLLQKVYVALSVGNGRPIEVYSAKVA